MKLFSKLYIRIKTEIEIMIYRRRAKKAGADLYIPHGHGLQFIKPIEKTGQLKNNRK